MNRRKFIQATAGLAAATVMAPHVRDFREALAAHAKKLFPAKGIRLADSKPTVKGGRR